MWTQLNQGGTVSYRIPKCDLTLQLARASHAHLKAKVAALYAEDDERGLPPRDIDGQCFYIKDVLDAQAAEEEEAGEQNEELHAAISYCTKRKLTTFLCLFFESRNIQIHGWEL